MNPASDSCSFLLAPAPCLSPSSTCRVPHASSDMMAGSDTHPAMYCSVSLHLHTAGPFVKLKLPDDQSAHDFIKTDCLGSPPLRLIRTSATAETTKHLGVRYLPSSIDAHQISSDSSGSSKFLDGMTGSQITAIFPASKFSGS